MTKDKNKDEERSSIGVLDISNPVLITESFDKNKWLHKTIGLKRGNYTLESIITTPLEIKEVWIRKDYEHTD